MATDPIVEAYLNQIAQQQASQAGVFNAEAYLSANPDVAAAMQREISNKKSALYGKTIADAAKYHYDTAGKAEGRQLPQTAAKYISTDGKTFATPDEYSAYQTNLDRTKTQTGTQQALAKARLQAEQAVTARGLNPAQYQPQIEAQLAKVQGLIPEFDSNPGSYFDSNLANDVLTGITAQNRQQYRSQAQTQLGQNFDLSVVPDNLLDSTINDILSTQSGEAKDAFDRGLKRGQYNDVGYQAGIKNLDTAKAGVQAKLGSTANDVLSGYRDKIDKVSTNAYNAATGYNLGDTFNLDDYLNQANSIAQDATKNAGGSFLNAVGTTPLFDLSTLTQKAGQAQGAVNLNNLDVLDALEKKKAANSVGRGLGSEGAF